MPRRGGALRKHHFSVTPEAIQYDKIRSDPSYRSPKPIPWVFLSDLKTFLESHGGKLQTRITKQTTHFLALCEEDNAFDSRAYQRALSEGLPVVKLDWVYAIIDRAAGVIPAEEPADENHADHSGDEGDGDGEGDGGEERQGAGEEGADELFPTRREDNEEGEPNNSNSVRVTTDNHRSEHGEDDDLDDKLQEQEQEEDDEKERIALDEDDEDDQEDADVPRPKRPRQGPGSGQKTTTGINKIDVTTEHRNSNSATSPHPPKSNPHPSNRSSEPKQEKEKEKPPKNNTESRQSAEVKALINLKVQSSQLKRNNNWKARQAQAK